MTSAHDMIHLGHCGEVGHCRYVGGPGGEQCDALDGVLAQVEDDRAHAEAEKLRAAVSKDAAHRPKWQAAVLEAADMVDPYEMRDGQPVRKADGKPVTL